MEDILTTLRRLNEQEDITSFENPLSDKPKTPEFKRISYKDLFTTLLKEEGQSVTNEELKVMFDYFSQFIGKGYMETPNGKEFIVIDDTISEKAFRRYLEENNKTITNSLKMSLAFHALNKQGRYKNEFNKETDENVRRFFIQINNEFQNNPTDNSLIIFLWREKIYRAFGFDNTQGENIADTITDLNFIDYFFNHQKLLTNTQAFWIVFDRVFNWSDLNNIYQEQWLECFAEYERLDGLFLDRLRMAKGRIVFQNAKQDFMNYNLEEDIPIYRGFLTREGKFVRKGITKLNNPDAEKQDEGSGLSYSLSKANASFFAHRYHFLTDLIFQQKLPSIFGEVTEEKYKEEVLKIFKHKIDESYLSAKARRTLCSYKIKKKDIIWSAGKQLVELEVIADPNQVRLQRYDFMNDKMEEELGKIRIEENDEIQENQSKVSEQELKAFARTMPEDTRREFEKMYFGRNLT